MDDSGFPRTPDIPVKLLGTCVHYLRSVETSIGARGPDFLGGSATVHRRAWARPWPAITTAPPTFLSFGPSSHIGTSCYGRSWLNCYCRCHAGTHDTAVRVCHGRRHALTLVTITVSPRALALSLKTETCLRAPSCQNGDTTAVLYEPPHHHARGRSTTPLHCALDLTLELR